jgi:hypothetical protein
VLKGYATCVSPVSAAQPKTRLHDVTAQVVVRHGSVGDRMAGFCHRTRDDNLALGSRYNAQVEKHDDR